MGMGQLHSHKLVVDHYLDSKPHRAMPIPKKSSAKKPAAKKPAAKKLAAKKPAKRKANPALMKPVQPDAVLAVIVGSKPLPRGALTKALWDYIKKHKLQDAKKRTMINADDALKVVFGGKKQVSMFEMTKLVSGHVKA